MITIEAPTLEDSRFLQSTVPDLGIVNSLHQRIPFLAQSLLVRLQLAQENVLQGCRPDGKLARGGPEILENLRWRWVW